MTARAVESALASQYPLRVDPTARRLLILTTVMLAIIVVGRWLAPADGQRARVAQPVEQVAPDSSAEPAAEEMRLDVQPVRIVDLATASQTALSSLHTIPLSIRSSVSGRTACRSKASAVPCCGTFDSRR